MDVTTQRGAANDNAHHPGAICASLDGPTIARLFDAAETASSRAGRLVTIHELAARILTDWASSHDHPGDPMTPAQIAAHIEAAHADLTRILEVLDTGLRTLAKAQPGIRSVPTDAGGSRGSSDPSWRVLDQATAQSADPALADAKALALHAVSIERNSRDMRHILSRWTNHATLTAEDIWCQHCTHHGHPSQPRGSENRRVGKIAVCGWCYDWHREHRVLPTRAEVDQHARTGRVRRKVG